jgi:hypothetical protein
MAKKILIFDDVVHDRGQTRESKLEGFASRLQNREHFSCVAILPVDDRGFRLSDHSAEAMGEWLKTICIDQQAEGVVIDLAWWGDSTFGEKMWHHACANGLLLDSRCVVFISEHATIEERMRILEKSNLSPNQVVYRNADGFDIAAKWLIDHI